MLFCFRHMSNYDKKIYFFQVYRNKNSIISSVTSTPPKIGNWYRIYKIVNRLRLKYMSLKKQMQIILLHHSKRFSQEQVLEYHSLAIVVQQKLDASPENDLWFLTLKMYFQDSNEASTFNLGRKVIGTRLIMTFGVIHKLR